MRFAASGQRDLHFAGTNTEGAKPIPGSTCVQRYRLTLVAGLGECAPTPHQKICGFINLRNERLWRL
jgi:hypothetical protein